MKASLAFALMATSLVSAGPDELLKKEIALWQGDWQAVSFETDGKQLPPEPLKHISLRVTGTDYIFQNAGAKFSERGSYRFYPDQNPKQLDILVGEGADKGKIYRTIYMVDGDLLTICLRSDNKERPTEFTGKAGSGCVLERWLRKKP